MEIKNTTDILRTLGLIAARIENSYPIENIRHDLLQLIEDITMNDGQIKGTAYYTEDRITDLENEVEKFEIQIENLEEDVLNLKANNKQFLTNGGYITTEDVLKAICKKSNIRICDIDTTPTIKD